MDKRLRIGIAKTHPNSELDGYFIIEEFSIIIDCLISRNLNYCRLELFNSIPLEEVERAGKLACEGLRNFYDHILANSDRPSVGYQIGYTHLTVKTKDNGGELYLISGDLSFNLTLESLEELLDLAEELERKIDINYSSYTRETK